MIQIIGLVIIVAVLGLIIKSPLKVLAWLITIGAIIWLMFSYTKYFFYAISVLIAIGIVKSLIDRSKLRKKIQQLLDDKNYEDLVFELTDLKGDEKLTTLKLIEDIAQSNELSVEKTLGRIFCKTIEMKIVSDLKCATATELSSIERFMENDIKIYSKIAPTPGIRETIENIANKYELKLIGIKSLKGKDETLIKAKSSDSNQANEISLDDD